MNPFQRLRHTIDKVNITYQFPEQQPQVEVKTAASPDVYQPNTQKTMISGSNDELQRIKQLCNEQQLSYIKQLTDMSAKIEQLQKSNKRSQNVIENQMNELVTLQKQNELLKGNLNQQYTNVVQGDQKQRKYKEQIYRINVTINQLAVQIQNQRNHKKQLVKETQNLREELKNKNLQFDRYRQEAEKDKLRIQTQLEERISMFEYNVKKAAQDRKQFKITLTTQQQNHNKDVQKCKSQIQNLKTQLFEAKKAYQIENVHRKTLQDTLSRQRQELSLIKQENKHLNQEIQLFKQKSQKSQKNIEFLQKNVNDLGSQLAEEKRNMKIKVVEVRDETLNLELQMYKKQCKQLLQQKYILKNMIVPQEGGALQPEYKIVKSHQTNSV